MTLTRARSGSGKAGFTLVEVIVILVILAILAALLIPALSGYIDKAKDRAIVAETRQAVMAAQTLLSESYGLGDPSLERTEIKQLSEVSGTVSFFEHKKGLLEHLIYNNGQEYCTYCRAAADGSTCPSCGATAMYTVEGRLPENYVISLMDAVPKLEIANLTSDNNKTLYQYFISSASIDSTTVNGTNFPKVRDALAAAGFDTMSGSWSIIKNTNGDVTKYNYRIYYTSEDISKMNADQSVTVTIYNPVDGKYYVGKSMIKRNTLDGQTYNILSHVPLDKNVTELVVDD